MGLYGVGNGIVIVTGERLLFSDGISVVTAGRVIVVDSFSSGEAQLTAELTEPLQRKARAWKPRCQKCNRLNPDGTSRCNWCGGKVK